jgi:hypothetical protein
MTIHFTGIQRVSHEEDRQREADYWSKKTIAERVIAGWELAENDLVQRDHHEQAERPAFTLRRIPRAADEGDHDLSDRA